MADSRISELAALAETPATGDLFEIVDVSDTSMAASGTNKKITRAYLVQTAAEILAALLTVDGAGSGLDADLLDGQSSAYYLAASSYTAADVLSKLLTVDGSGSGLDADLLDGSSSAAFAQVANNLSDLANASTARTNLGLAIGTDVQAYSAVLAALASLFTAASASGPASLLFHEDTDNGTNKATVTAPASLASDVTVTLPSTTGVLVPDTAIPFVLTFVLSDETTALTTGEKLRYRMPFAATLYAGNAGVRLEVTTASSSGLPQVDIKESGTTIFSTKPTIDINEKTSLDATTAVVISDTALADDAELTFIVDTAGTGTTGLKVTLRGTRTV